MNAKTDLACALCQPYLKNATIEVLTVLSSPFERSSAGPRDVFRHP